MKRNHLVIFLAFLMLAPLFTLNCSRDDTAIVRIQLVNVPQGAAQSSNSVFERVFRWFVPNAWAGATWSYTFDRLIVRVTAPDFETMEFDIPISERELSFELPAGPERRITVYGMNNDAGLFFFDKNWGGHVEIHLNPGDDITAQIDMLPMPKIYFVSYVNATTLNVEWTGITPNWGGFTQYNLYRSTNPDGPYEKVATALAGQPNVNDVHTFVMGTMYYYKVNVSTPSREGELSGYSNYFYAP